VHSFQETTLVGSAYGTFLFALIALSLMLVIPWGMDSIQLQALHYETLLKAANGAEAKAAHAFEKAVEYSIINESLVLHTQTYAELLGVEASAISNAYYDIRPVFEAMDSSVHILGWDSPHWPKQVDSFAFRPRFLYVQGNESLLSQSSVSVIGTRSPSLEGKQLALATAKSLTKAGYVVASGLALGIDGVAHKAALAAGGPTIAVIGTPINAFYPPEHRDLQLEIAKVGAVVSRFSPATVTQKWHFLLRNRLMSALSDASVVVEDRDGGGAVRQAAFALEQKKYLFIYQSSVDNHSILWPRQFANQSRVFVIKKSQDLPRLLNQAKKTREGVGKPKQKAVQLNLF
jgi:DNA processing protein